MAAGGPGPEGGPASGPKRRLRAQLRRAWRALPPAELERAARQAAAHLASRPEWQGARCVAVYLARADELPTAPLIALAGDAGKRLCAPVVGTGGAMELRAYHPDRLRSGPFGILEPDPGTSPAVDPADVDLIVVPGLAFDRRGARLGKGGGYYDRFLPRLRPEAVRVGWTLSRFVLPALPEDPHDQRVHLLTTEAGVLAALPTGTPPTLG